MSTTSLKLPDDVKALAAKVAHKQGVSPHAFMVGAIKSAATNAEKHARFVDDAVAAHKEAIATGAGHIAAGVHAYVRQRAKGRVVDKPGATAWRK